MQAFHGAGSCHSTRLFIAISAISTVTCYDNVIVIFNSGAPLLRDHG